ncbi:transglutaminase TgpA family protein [Tumebacillus flagellatus]|uniref:Transglutaminase-like domain-containing protein n=1 Tax=Tumebacillus flagellatus TaxID=1157490 RepID=A0A074LLV8_9BACL|nr:transglutaminase domain-containing protein [Tumebacillus flagellatus]KEO81530.1 hypothetical protein EL26_20230 [Tumebacillus flagellatus]
MLRTARWVTGSAARELVLFALIWYWMLQLLLPFGEATRMPSVFPFALFVGCLFVIDYALRHWAWRSLLKLVLVLVFLKILYYPNVPFYDPGWVSAWLLDLYFAISSAFSVSLPMLSEGARTTGFFVALLLLQTTFRQALRHRVWMFLFLILGTVGLGVLDTFFVEDAKWHIVQFLLVGLVMLAFMQLPLIERVARMPIKIKGWPAEWLLWTIALSLVVVGTASAAPKHEAPSWPDPVAFLQGKSGDGPVHQKIGYGNDDRQLGGPFEMDDSVVFTVTTAGEGYFRGEAKTVYTGKGWLSGSLGIPVGVKQNLKPYQNYEAGNMDELSLLDVGGMLANTSVSEAKDTILDTKEIKQTFSFEQNMVPVVFNQYRMTGIADIQNASDQTRYSGIDSRFDLTSLYKGDSYTVVSQIPFFDEKALKGANVPTITRGMEPYVSLPTTLPQRVKDLAKEITKDAKTPYERALALESYLRSNYIYDTQNVPVPKADQDFVDQFLFDSKRGYCDHFSSSMVVMARALGMPARWVKGFTMGDPDLSWKSPVEGEYKYVVKNKNAHSWPEIYFDKIGWVAFEPTATFNMQRNYKQDQETVAPLPVPTDPAKRDKNETQDHPTKTSYSIEINWKAVGQYVGYAAIAALILALFNRRKLMTAYYLRRAYRGDGDVVLNAVVRLFLVLEKLGWRRQSDMTLREYAQQLSSAKELSGREMVPLAKIFERVRYGQASVGDKDRHQIRDLWTRLVRKAGRQKRRK